MSERGTCTACGTALIWARSTATGQWMALERVTHLYRVEKTNAGHADTAAPVRDATLFVAHLPRCPEPERLSTRRRRGKLP